MAAGYSNKRVTVMGLGRFGGGVGVVQWLVSQGARVLVTDRAPSEQLTDSLTQIQELIDTGAVELRLGGHDRADFQDADFVVVNPAVPTPWKNPFLKAAIDSGARITTEIRLLVECLPNRNHTVGVTGTAGKSTTAAMIAHILRELSPKHLIGARVWLGGNIGGSLLSRAEEISADDWVVLELSSAQLYWLGDWFVGWKGEAGFSPHVAVVTNVTPNHLDWHETFEHYERCKRNIACFQKQSARDVFLEPAASQGKGVGQALGELNVVGAHNRNNAALAMDSAQTALTSQGVNVDDGFLLGSLRTFIGLPHRLQLVAGARRGEGVIRAYNDSKSTTPEATALAVAAFEEDPAVGARRVHLIVGGYDKGVDLAPMIAPAASCRAVYTVGATGAALADSIRIMSENAIECGTLDSAISKALASAAPGEVIVLSPGCASWDQFSNYEERGRRFAGQICRGLGRPEPPVDLFEMPASV